jgi:hypothetical protein
MARICLTVCVLSLSTLIFGCGGEEKKVIVEPTVEQKAQLDTQHQAMSNAQKAGQPVPPAGAAAPGAPAAAGHAR